MRLDAYLAQYWPEYSRSTWQKYVKAGYVKVNGKVETSTKRTLAEDDEVTADIPDMPRHDKETLAVIYKDENVIVINKPVGVLSHSKGALNDEFTVADFFKKFSTYNSDTNRPGIVHRLDRDTSGVMIGALNDKAAKLLQRQFTDRKAHKTYVAVVDGVPKMEEAVIDLPIGRNPKKPSQFRVDPKGKSAQTVYKVMAAGKKHSLVELQPLTGRTHQLRVHMAHIGTPIHGDKVYGKDSDRLYLHAAKLEITIPGSDETSRLHGTPERAKTDLSEEGISVDTSTEEKRFAAGPAGHGGAGISSGSGKPGGERMVFAATVPPEFAEMEK